MSVSWLQRKQIACVITGPLQSETQVQIVSAIICNVSHAGRWRVQVLESCKVFVISSLNLWLCEIFMLALCSFAKTLYPPDGLSWLCAAAWQRCVFPLDYVGTVPLRCDVVSSRSCWATSALRHCIQLPLWKLSTDSNPHNPIAVCAKLFQSSSFESVIKKLKQNAWRMRRFSRGPLSSLRAGRMIRMYTTTFARSSWRSFEDVLLLF